MSLFSIDVIRVLEAICFEKLLTGGTTRPWLVLALERGSIKPYVLKIYGYPQHFYYPKISEIVCSELAPHFGLNVPEWGFINIPNDAELPETLRTQLMGKDARYNFGTIQIEGSFPFTGIKSIKPLIKNYNIETIFAFDSLIQNVDRKNDKPNILFKGKTAYLIDHEKTLYINPEKCEFKDYRFVASSTHIFQPHLKGLTNPNKNICFDPFINQLKKLNLTQLDSKIRDAANRLQLDTENYETIRYYLENIIDNADRFKSILIEQIA